MTESTWRKVQGQCILCKKRSLRYRKYVNGRPTVGCRQCESIWTGPEKKDVVFAAVLRK